MPIKAKLFQQGDTLPKSGVIIWAVFVDGETRESRILIAQYPCCGVMRAVDQKTLYNKERNGRRVCSACNASRMRKRAIALQKKSHASFMARKLAEPYGVDQPLWPKPPSATGGIWEDSRS